MRRIGAALVATACLTALPACGSASPAHSPQPDREWIDNTAGVIDQLQGDLTLQASGGGTLRAAREALRAGLYPSLVAYTDFGGCNHMVAAAGSVPTGFAVVSRSLDSACALLQRAATLFTRAASRHDPAALLHAGRVASSAAPLLVRAEVELKSLSQATATSR
jgi:hypothetical protein